MRIATWNINGLRARLDYLLGWLAEREPDVVGLQELKLADGDFPHQALESVGYCAAVHGQKAWNGVAVLSRRPVQVRNIGLPGQEEMGARLISAEVDDIGFTTVYVPNGKAVEHRDFVRKLDWLDALARYIEAEGKPAAVLCGDFNVCPSGLDSWNEAAFKGSIFHTDDERVRFRRLLDSGLEDLYRVEHPDEQAFSWWDYRGGAFHRGQGLRIDFLLGTPAVRATLQSVTIDRDFRTKRDGMTPSDHAPVYADLA